MSVPSPRPATDSLELAEPLRARLGALALARYPNEACGLLLGRRAGTRAEVLEVREARNRETRGARYRYELDPGDLVAAETHARAAGLEVVGVWHSHPDRPAVPSASDRAAAWSAWSYLIVSVEASAVRELRAWRLAGARFREERLLP